MEESCLTEVDYLRLFSADDRHPSINQFHSPSLGRSKLSPFWTLSGHLAASRRKGVFGQKNNKLTPNICISQHYNLVTDRKPSETRRVRMSIIDI